MELDADSIHIVSNSNNVQKNAVYTKRGAHYYDSVTDEIINIAELNVPYHDINTLPSMESTLNDVIVNENINPSTHRTYCWKCERFGKNKCSVHGNPRPAYSRGSNTSKPRTENRKTKNNTLVHDGLLNDVASLQGRMDAISDTFDVRCEELQYAADARAKAEVEKYKQELEKKKEDMKQERIRQINIVRANCDNFSVIWDTAHESVLGISTTVLKTLILWIVGILFHLLQYWLWQSSYSDTIFFFLEPNTAQWAASILYYPVLLIISCRHLLCTTHHYKYLSDIVTLHTDSDGRQDTHKSADLMHSDPVLARFNYRQTKSILGLIPIYWHNEPIVVSMELLSQISTMSQHSLVEKDKDVFDRICSMARACSTINLSRYNFLSYGGADISQFTAILSFSLHKHRQRLVKNHPFPRAQ